MLNAGLVQNYIDMHASRTPDNVAVDDGQDSITYGELERLSNQFAFCLRHNGISRQDRVVLCMKRSVGLLISILGILKSDAIYVPVDPNTPLLRWQKLVTDCRPGAIICDGTTAEKIRSAEWVSNEAAIIRVDQRASVMNLSCLGSSGWVGLENQVNHRPDCQNTADDVAYIMYTSGSSGQPKGVIITHRNIATYVEWAVDYLNLSCQDRILSSAPFHFDMSTFDVYCSLKAGCPLCIASDLMMVFPEKLVEFIEKKEITVWKGVSSLLMYMARVDVIRMGRMPSLRTILFAGEPFPAKYLIRWMDAYPDKRFINAYGPTEATGVSLFHLVENKPQSARERIPIGKPCKDTVVFLIKDDMSPAGRGEVGELCIAGPCLAKGYLNDPLKTATSFMETSPAAGLPDRYYRSGDLALLRDDDNYEYVSRKDFQVKVMGYRIELGEVEHALLSIDGVDDAVAVVAESPSHRMPELVAYFQSHMDLTPAVIMQELRGLLPAYMLPKIIQKISSIPRNERGKIDREAACQGSAGLAVG